jgi:multidrug transporter EmrE-like cation transporter
MTEGCLSRGDAMYLFLAVMAALLFTIGGVFMNHSAGLTRLAPSLLVYLFFAAGASLQTLAMRTAGLGMTYVLVLGLEAVLSIAFGALFFKEGCSLQKLFGAATVVAGIIILRQSE